jgi:hypothetical protein
MRLVRSALTTVVLAFLSPAAFLAQSSQPASSISMPRLVSFSGTFRPVDGQPTSAVETVALAIYAEETGGTPLWQETQRVAVDAEGRYTLLLGASQADGIPLDVFASGEAKWLGVVFQRSNEVEGPRMRITSVPYALHAADAATLGGHPASAYMLAPTASGERTTSGDSTTVSNVGASTHVLLPGTPNFLPKYLNAVDIGNSALYETGGRVGINTPLPADYLHVRFNDPFGAFTGLAVQNLANSANAASGMLFYDHNGALGQFQGFNNSSHAYVINNIATNPISGLPDGSINFLVGSVNRLRVNSDGRIGLGANGTISATNAGSRGQAAGWVPPGSSGNGVFIEGGNGPGDEGGGFYADGNTAAIWSPGDADILRVYDEDTIVPGQTPPPRFLVDGLGDIRVGISPNGCVRRGDGVTIAGTCSSDERLKRDIRPFDNSMLERALKLRPVYFRWREELLASQAEPKPGEAYGFIAQEVQKIYPEMVTTDSRGYLAVDYSKLQYVLLGALQEEHDKVQSLEARVAKLEAARLSTSLWGWFAGLGAVGFACYRRGSSSTRGTHSPS